MPDTFDLPTLSKQQILDFAKPTKEYEEMLSIWPPLRNINWSEKFSAIAKLRTQTEIADELDEIDPNVKETFVQCKARDGYNLSLRIFQSYSAADAGDVIVLYHGGGWCMGSTTMVAEIARNLVKKYDKKGGNVVVIAPKYRLAPENIWPKSLEDGWDALEYVREKFVTDKKKFVVGGISAGASMSLVYAHMARDEWTGEKRIDGIWSSCGSVRVRELESLEDVYRERLLSRMQDECVRNPVLSPEMQKLLRECVQADEESQWYNCLAWGENKAEEGKYGHHGLPKTYLQICGRDGSRDEGLILEDMLKREGIKTRLDLYRGLPHCFWIALQHVPEFKRWERYTMDGFEWLLSDSS